MAPRHGSRTGRHLPSGCEGLHRVENVGLADIAVRYVCRTCDSSVEVEFPTHQNWTAVRAWLNRHPGTMRV